MAKTKSSKSKGRANKRNNKKHKLQFQPQQKKAKLIQKSRNDDADDPIIFGPSTFTYEPAPAPVPGPEYESDSDTPSPTRIHTLLEPYAKDQLISFLLDAAESDPSLRARIRSAADSDISHRKIFVHGLSWDTTNADLLEAIAPFGPTEGCNVVMDRVTGRAKGFGFVIFKTRSSAIKALEVPQKMVKSRLASFNLASAGPAANPSLVVSSATPTLVPVAEERRVYVSNVHVDTSPDKLRTLFAKFGEIEAGPVGFDKNTGKSRGYAIFIYKNQESARRAIEEPYKMFEGHQFHCQLYTPSNKAKTAALMQLAVATPPPPQQQPAGMLLGQAPQSVLAAMAAAQNLALLGQNPAYSMLLAQNPLLAAAMNPAMMMQAYGGGVGMGGPTAGGGPQSLLGMYGQGSAAGMQGFPGANTQPGQTSSGNSGSMFGGFPSSFM